MAFNPVDLTYAIIKETTPGTIPGTGNLLELPVDVNATTPQVEADTITSPVSRPQRSVEAQRRVNYRGEGSFGLHLAQNAAIELLMSSVLSNAWATSVLKGGNTDQPFSLEEKLSASQFRRFLGNYGTSLQLTVDFNGNAALSIGFIGISGTTATTATSLTLSPAAASKKLTGLDVSAASIGGQTGLVYNRAVLTINQPREPQGQFGSASAFGVGANGPRNITLELQTYHADLVPYTTFLTSDTPVAASFTVGSTGNGFTFALPAGVPSTPKRNNAGSAVMTNIVFSASHDTTAATDIVITKL